VHILVDHDLRPTCRTASKVRDPNHLWDHLALHATKHSSKECILSEIIVIKAVAEARGYKNPRSVVNQFTNVKKRYNLPITASQSGSRRVDDSGSGISY
jgi:hypothetical protein